jgi:hypothetical protein
MIKEGSMVSGSAPLMKVSSARLLFFSQAVMANTAPKKRYIHPRPLGRILGMDFHYRSSQETAIAPLVAGVLFLLAGAAVLLLCR